MSSSRRISPKGLARERERRCRSPELVLGTGHQLGIGHTASVNL
jgi:hypothetical protein